MLIDNPRKFVNLVVDNFVWGNLAFNDKSTNDVVYKRETEFIGHMAKFVSFRLTKKEIPEDVIHGIFTGFLVLRGTNRLVGILQDREHEKTIEKYEKDNAELATLVENAYIPSPDTKVGTL